MPRIDRFITTALMHPWIAMTTRLRPRARANAIPILMYHSISDSPEPRVPAYYRLATPPELFRAHLDILQKEKFRSVSLEDAFHAPNGGSSIAAAGKQVVITFDDGFDDFRTAASPLLEEFGFSATMFLPTGFIGHTRRAFMGRDCLTWSDARALQDRGMRFGSHTVTHPKLWELGDRELQRELRQSRETIEQELGVAVNTFAHPYAFPSTTRAYVDRFTTAMSDAAYRCGVTTTVGRARRADHQFTLNRLPVNGADDPALFRAKLRGAYDWMAHPQRMMKRVKSLVRL